MNWQKLAPWNWFQDEEKESVQSHISPTPASQLQPRSSMLDLHREFDRLFTDLWRNTGWPSQFGNTSGITNHQWLRPSVDIKENEESFEFKVNASKPVTLADLNNADGRGQDTKLFTFSHWGKTSRSANDTIAVSAVQDEFEDLGNGWYRASCTLTIPDEISLLRSFEIAKVQGNWNSLEIRKHHIRLLSDSITSAKYVDDMALKMLADDQADSMANLKDLKRKEMQEIFYARNMP